jgi:hypothetical protein
LDNLGNTRVQVSIEVLGLLGFGKIDWLDISMILSSPVLGSSDQDPALDARRALTSLFEDGWMSSRGIRLIRRHVVMRIGVGSRSETR